MSLYCLPFLNIEFSFAYFVNIQLTLCNILVKINFTYIPKIFATHMTLFFRIALSKGIVYYLDSQKKKKNFPPKNSL
ncbi:hypothetical protein C2G38_2107625 [Gigaspora rosea]|uniref:Uncharacterized protein n=1 Tax=Gigaspora rosea TaxID=44941 RepID=A0A397UI67_9GLOM|nr:hypothetical protein C2G38_2107625 [Gigaspora rosea]